MENSNNQQSSTAHTENLAQNLQTKLCRLCLYYSDETKVDIFDERLNEDHDHQRPLEEILYNLFHIKYDKSSIMPRVICQRCFDVVKAFNKFSTIMKNNEEQLKNGLPYIMNINEQDIASKFGLNDIPGILVPEEGSEIIEVDPDQDYVSSDDDFFATSNTDGEENSNDIPKSIETMNNTMHSKENSLAIPNVTNETYFKDNATSSAQIFQDNSRVYKSAYLCQYCDIAFTTYSECAQHEAQHNPNAPYKCNSCLKHYTNRPSLISHVREEHNAKKPYICTFCRKGFFRRCDLKKHSIVHTGLRPYSCSICNKSFSRNTTLTKHMRLHKSAEPYACQYCPRSFATAVELVQHGRLHAVTSNPVYNFPLPQQHKSLPNDQIENSVEQQRSVAMTTPNINQKSTLLQKTSTHHRQYVCNICSKSFTRERDLQQHRALHLDTLFTCKQCGMGFSRREKLTRHEQIEHGPHYTCDLCNLTFFKREDQEMHLKMHELRENAAQITQQAELGAAANLIHSNINTSCSSSLIVPQKQQQSQSIIDSQKPSADELAFYSNLVPTMNLGFYSEARTDDSNSFYN